jgi:acetaldehyde dehydrogenase (acetylating)
MVRRVVSVSQNAVAQAESEIQSCDQCGSNATTPFWQILHKLRSKHGLEQVVYVLPVLACCPGCRALIDEMTLVEPKSGLVLNSGSQILSQSEA